VRMAQISSQSSSSCSSQVIAAVGPSEDHSEDLARVQMVGTEESEVELPVLGLRRNNTFSHYNEDGAFEWEALTCQPVVAMWTTAPEISEAVPVVEEAAAERRDLMKRQKKLREIERIEARVAAGEKIDPLQQAKLGKKDEAMAAVLQAEEALAEAEQATRERSMAQQGVAEASAWMVSSAMPSQMGDESSQALADQMLWANFQVVPVEVGPGCSAEVAGEMGLCVEEQASHHLHMIEQAQLQAEARHAKEAQWSQEKGLCPTSRRRRRRGEKAAALPAHLASQAPDSMQMRQLGSDASTSFETVRCEELSLLIDSTVEQRSEAIANISGFIRQLSFSAAGCRLVQQALQTVDVSTGSELVKELHDEVREALQSPHANYVIQKVIEVMPLAQSSFIAKEIQGIGAQVARHRYGCRILCRLMEHASVEPSTTELMTEVLEDAGGLCRHSFGHHVIQSILEHGSLEQKQQIIEALSSDLPRNARNRNASYVLERVFVHCNLDHQRDLLRKLLAAGHEMWALLARNHLGAHVAKSLSKFPDDISLQALSEIQLATGKLQGTRHGKRLLKDLGLINRPVGAAVEAW